MEIKCNCEHKLTEGVELYSDEKLRQLEKFYSAFSAYSRLKIINALDKAELCVCELSRIVSMTKSAVSHQLSYLKELGLIKSRKAGKEVFYSLSDAHVKMIFEVAMEHIEETRGK